MNLGTGADATPRQISRLGKFWRGFVAANLAALCVGVVVQLVWGLFSVNPENPPVAWIASTSIGTLICWPMAAVFLYRLWFRSGRSILIVAVAAIIGAWLVGAAFDPEARAESHFLEAGRAAYPDQSDQQLREMATLLCQTLEAGSGGDVDAAYDSFAERTGLAGQSREVQLPYERFFEQAVAYRCPEFVGPPSH